MNGGRSALPGGLRRQPKDQLLSLYGQEEHETAQEEPGPFVNRNGLSAEERLKGWRVGEESLCQHHRADAVAEVRVAEVGPAARRSER